MNAWIGMVGTLVGLVMARYLELYLPETGSRYHRTGRDCLDQFKHNDFEAWEGRSLACFVPVLGIEDTYLLVCPASHTYFS